MTKNIEKSKTLVQIEFKKMEKVKFGFHQLTVDSAAFVPTTVAVEMKCGQKAYADISQATLDSSTEVYKSDSQINQNQNLIDN